MEVEVISTECIKPSSPTPHHLKNHKLSFLDVSSDREYIPLVLYYPMNQDTNLTPSHIISERLQLLKRSLSETLSRFYPFAGKIKDAYSIDCNDEGVYFVEAKVKNPLSKFLDHPDISVINKFIPDEAKWTLIPGNYIAGVQATTFSCGGIVVGVYVAHIIADGAAFSIFLKSWAAAMVHKNTEEAICPKFDVSSIFPFNDAYKRNASSKDPPRMKLGKYITRRYLLDASAIAILKAKATSSGVQNPTRVQVVEALFVKCIMASLNARKGSDPPLLLNHAVNLRQRAIPQFSEYYMGNFVWAASVQCKHTEVELEDLVWQQKEATAKLNGDFVNGLQGDEGWTNYLETVKSLRELFFTHPEDKLLMISSWCNFGFYDLDFGWGKPAWVGIMDMGEKNKFRGKIVFMDTRHRDGIEAWACLLEEHIAALERDKEFLALVTADPNPQNK